MKLFRLILGILVLASPLGAEPMKSIEFHNQAIRDILVTLGELNGVSIVPDETVDGNASYVFANMDFQQALTAFLATYHLTATVKDNIYTISRVSLAVHPDGTVDLQADQVPLRSVLRVLARQVGKTILFDNLPNDPVTMNVTSAKVEDILKIAIARYPDFVLETTAQYDYLKNKSQSRPPDSGSVATEALKQTGDLYSFQVDHGRFSDLVKLLFQKAQKQDVLLLDRDQVIDNLHVSNLTFDDALRLLLLEVGGDFKVDKDVYYVYEVQRRDLMKRFLTTVVVPFQYISSADFLKLIPPNLNSNSFFRLDEKANRIVLSGSFEEIRPIWDFLKMIDRPQPGGETIRIDLKYVKTDDLIPLLPADLAGFTPVALPSKTSLIVTLPAAKKQDFLDFVAMIDQPSADVPIRLRYMKADDLTAHLPPSVTAANLVTTADPTLVFFRGSPQQLLLFQRDLDQLDVPRPLLRYEILVLQFNEGTALKVTPTVGIQSGDPSNAISGQFSPALGMTFDFVGNFGPGFVASLDASISENEAKVAADTSLSALSGEKVSFQNTTSTYYAANEISTTGTATVVGSVNSLSSGLILNLQGWISSNKMVTLQVDTTLSKQDATNTTSSSSNTTLPPNTSEKKLSTQVRMPSGQPLIIGGLKEDEKTVTKTKVPILGDIPLLGLLFQGTNATTSHTEYTVYIVPILDNPDEQQMSPDARMLLYYHRFRRAAS